jgi:hypothetical protein
MGWVRGHFDGIELLMLDERGGEAIYLGCLSYVR